VTAVSGLRRHDLIDLK